MKNLSIKTFYIRNKILAFSNFSLMCGSNSDYKSRNKNDNLGIKLENVSNPEVSNELHNQKKISIKGKVCSSFIT